jgi:hypothetical protein
MVKNLEVVSVGTKIPKKLSLDVRNVELSGLKVDKANTRW